MRSLFLDITFFNIRLAWLALVVVGSATAVMAEPVTIQVTEQTPLVIDPDTFPSHNLVPGTLRHIGGPKQGVVVGAIGGSLPAYGNAATGFVYQADAEYLGFDSLAFVAVDQETEKEVRLNLEIRVIPSAFPFSGRFFAHSGASFGLYRQQERKMELCLDAVVDDSTLVCSLHRVPEASPGWWPVYGDWDGDGMHLPSLFDPATATLHQLQLRGRDLRIVSSLTFSGLEWTFPAAGDWDGAGFDEPLFVTRRGEIQRRRLFPSGNLTLNFVKDLGPPIGGAFPWLARWPVGDRDALALVELAARRLRWVSTGRPGASQGFAALRVDDPGVVPLQGDLPFIGAGSSIYILHFAPWQGQASPPIHWLGYGSGGGFPTTMPLKFPHEPPGR